MLVNNFTYDTQPLSGGAKISRQLVKFAVENLPFTAFALAVFAVAQLYWEVKISHLQVTNLYWNIPPVGPQSSEFKTAAHHNSSLRETLKKLNPK